MKEVIILRGPCGAGKTTLRERAYPDHYVIDMADAPKAGFEERFSWLKRKLSRSKDRPTVVEGIYAPDSPSLACLREVCKKREYATTEITVMRPIEACLEARKGDVVRTQFIRQYHHQFD